MVRCYRGIKLIRINAEDQRVDRHNKKLSANACNIRLKEKLSFEKSRSRGRVISHGIIQTNTKKRNYFSLYYFQSGRLLWNCVPFWYFKIFEKKHGKTTYWIFWSFYGWFYGWFQQVDALVRLILRNNKYTRLRILAINL